MTERIERALAPRPPSLLRGVRNKFMAGLIILIPILITAQALWWLFTFVDGFLRVEVSRLIGYEIPGIGFVSIVLLVFVIGLLFSAGPLRRLLDSLEDVVEYIPFVGAMYGTVKKVLEGFGSSRSRQAFQRFVLARLPGRTTPGFLTGSFTLQHGDGSEQPLCTVYIPSNHLWFGDVVVVPAEDVIETALSVEEGISVILSGGAAMPSRVEGRAPAARETRRAPGPG